MKSKLIAGALFVSLAVNAVLIWQLGRPASVQPAPLDGAIELGEDATLESARELAFLRELVTKWSTFQSSTYLQSQVNLLPLLSPALAEERRKEIQRLSKRFRDQTIEQETKMTSLTENSEGHFVANVRLFLNEEKKKTIMTAVHQIETEKDIPSLENAWGFRAKSVSADLIETSDRQTTLPLEPGHPTVLSFPCAVRGVSNLDPAQVKFKLVTMKESELILNVVKNWSGTLPLQIECEKLVFNYQLQIATPNLRFYAVENSEGRTPLKNVRTQHPNRDVVKRSLEHELGFEIEESDK